MLNTYINRETRYVPTHVDIHEHRAATDESVELLKELEQEALKKIISVNRLENNSVEATWTVYRDNFQFERTMIIQFKINGVEHEVRVPCERRVSTNDLARKAFKAIAEAMAEKILTSIANVNGMVREITG